MSTSNENTGVVPDRNRVDSTVSQDSNDGDSISKLDLNVQANGVSPKGPSGTTSSFTRSGNLMFINYTPEDGSEGRQCRDTSTAENSRSGAESNGPDTSNHHRSRSSQSSTHPSPHERPRSRSGSSTHDLSGSTLGSGGTLVSPTANDHYNDNASIASAFSTLRAGTRTADGSPFPLLTPEHFSGSAGAALPPPLYTPRCPTCGRRAATYDHPLNTSTSNGIPSSRLLTPHRPAPPPPTSTTPALASSSAGHAHSSHHHHHHRHRANALTSTPPFRLQSPPPARRRGAAAAAVPRPSLFRTRTSPLTASLAHPSTTTTTIPSSSSPSSHLRVEADASSSSGAGAPRRRSQSDVRHDRRVVDANANTTPPTTPPRTPRLRPSIVVGGANRGGHEMLGGRGLRAVSERLVEEGRARGPVGRRRRRTGVAVVEGGGSGGAWEEEFEGVVGRLRDVFAGEDRGGRKVILEVLGGMVEGRGLRLLGTGGGMCGGGVAGEGVVGCAGR